MIIYKTRSVGPSWLGVWKRPVLHPLALAIALQFQGCTVSQSAQWAVSRYCGLPEPARSANREAVALALAPNRLTVDCARDQ